METSKFVMGWNASQACEKETITDLNARIDKLLSIAIDQETKLRSQEAEIKTLRIRLEQMDSE